MSSLNFDLKVGLRFDLKLLIYISLHAFDNYVVKAAIKKFFYFIREMRNKPLYPIRWD